MENKTPPGERIAKVIARAGRASRREAERMIEAGRVSVNGAVITRAALNVTSADKITVDGKTVAEVKSTVTTPDGGSMGYLMVRREYGESGHELEGHDEAGGEYTLTVTERKGEILTGVEE